MTDTAPRVLIGTTKGAFMLDGSPDRTGWAVRGPYCAGWTINHVVGDPATGRMWAGGGGEWSGAGVWRSDDAGYTWSLAQLTNGEADRWAAQDPDFAAMIGWSPRGMPFGERFAQVWSLGLAGERLYAGTKPAALLSSDDEGRTWQIVEALTDHPSAADRPPVCRRLAARCRRARAAYHHRRPGRRSEGLDRDLRGRRLREQGRGCDLGAAQTTSPPPPPAATSPAAGAARSGGACTTSSARRVSRICSTSRTTTASGVPTTEVSRGTTLLPVCRRPSASRSACTRVTRRRSGRSRSTGIWPAGSRWMPAAAVWRSRDGGRTWAAPSRSAAAGVLLHGAATGHGRRPARPRGRLLRH